MSLLFCAWVLVCMKCFLIFVLLGTATKALLCAMLYAYGPKQSSRTRVCMACSGCCFTADMMCFRRFFSGHVVWHVFDSACLADITKTFSIHMCSCMLAASVYMDVPVVQPCRVSRVLVVFSLGFGLREVFVDLCSSWYSHKGFVVCQYSPKQSSSTRVFMACSRC